MFNPNRINNQYIQDTTNLLVESATQLKAETKIKWQAF